MPRRRRKDYRGAWHHLTNRGIARRTVFERDADTEFFLERLAREVVRGTLELHAFSFLTTHYHFLVRSPRGRISEVMQRVGDAFVRKFNRERKRDGSLFRGRFTNRLVESEAYWLAVLRYIDRNAVGARLAARPVDYRYGSARYYTGTEGPPWLTRHIVESYATRDVRRGFAPGDYEAFSDRSLPPATRWMVERRLESPPMKERDPLDDLLGAAPARVRDWMERKALLADGTSPGLILATPRTLLGVLRERSRKDPARGLPTGRGPDVGFWEALAIWSLRQFAGLQLGEVGERMGRSVSTVHGRVRACTRAMAEDGSLREEAAAVLAEALERDFGGAPPSRRVPFVVPVGAPGLVTSAAGWEPN